MAKPPQLIVCGTDTDVGKTVVSAMVVLGLKASYWKPIQSGLEDGGDTGRICKILGLPKERCLPEAYKFKMPVSPHWAAEHENKIVEQSKLKLPLVKGPLVIETAGGLMVPLNRELLQVDQVKSWGLPVLLVARSGLGTLNHTLLSLEILKSRNICVLGLVLNGPHHADNPKTLEEIGGVPVISELSILPEITEQSLAEEWANQNLDITFKNLIATVNN